MPCCSGTYTHLKTKSHRNSKSLISSRLSMNSMNSTTMESCRHIPVLSRSKWNWWQSQSCLRSGPMSSMNISKPQSASTVFMLSLSRLSGWSKVLGKLIAHSTWEMITSQMRRNLKWSRSLNCSSTYWGNSFCRHSKGLSCLSAWKTHWRHLNSLICWIGMSQLN